MRNLVDIKYRMKGVSDTRQITSAMETISIAKMRKAMQKYETNLLYFNKVRSTISDIVKHKGTTRHKYLVGREPQNSLFVVIASDKGLAGGYNHNVLEFADSIIKTKKNSKVFTVGQMTVDYFNRKNIPIDTEFSHSTFNPTMRDAIMMVDSIINSYDNELVDEVYIVYTAMQDNHYPKPTIIKMLPLSQEDVLGEDKHNTVAEEDDLRELEYDPSPEDVLEVLIHQYLTGVIYGALVQSVACEHSQRRTAMSNSTKNAGEIIDRLRIEYNRARQAAVTTELTEIITSSMSVEQANQQ